MIGLAIAGVMAMICILVHTEAISLVDKLRDRVRSFRLSLLVTWSALLFAHVVEVWLYAMVYWLCDIAGVGGLQGMSSRLDYVYFSVVVYTTLGFGDIVPDSGVRLLAGSQALVGLCLIAWSATVTYGHVTHERPRRSYSTDD